MSEDLSNSKIPVFQPPPIAPRHQSIMPATKNPEQSRSGPLIQPRTSYKILDTKKNSTSSQIKKKKLTCNCKPIRKRTKTIFSVDLPLPSTGGHVEAGETGDGCYVLPKKMLSRTSVSSIGQQMSLKNSTEEKQQLVSDELRTIGGCGDDDFAYPRTKKIISQASLTSLVQALSSTDFSEDKKLNIEVKKKTSTISIRNSGSNIKRSQMKAESSSSVKASGGECKALLPESSTLILERISKYCFSCSFRIQNSTSSLHGFQATYLAHKKHVSINPIEGIVPANCVVTVSVEAKMERVNEMSIEGTSIEINTFPYSCLEKSSPSDVCLDIMKQQPDLIHTQRIERLIVWDAGDLARMSQLMNSIEDEQEKDLIKHEVYSHRTLPKKEYLVESTQRRFLRSIRNQVVHVNNTWMTILDDLTEVKQNQGLCLIFCAALIFLLCLANIQGGFVAEREAELRAQLEAERMPFWKRFLQIFR